MYVDIDEKDLERLPDELIAQLNLNNHQRMAMAIRAILAEYGELSIDQILIRYYQHTGKTIKRSVMVNRLYRMKNRGLVHSVNGKKGVYSYPPDKED